MKLLFDENLSHKLAIGAYEIVRTMCQAKDCFSQRVFDELVSLKKTLSTVRMPAAKMEKPGKRAPVISNRSPACLDVSNRDLLVNDPESTPDISARFILMEFNRLMSSITKNDILGHHEESYTGGPNKGIQPIPQSGDADASS